MLLYGNSHFCYNVVVSLENLEWKREVKNTFEFSVQNAVKVTDSSTWDRKHLFCGPL